MSDYNKPLPQPYVDSQPYWDYAKKHELRVQRCLDDGATWFPPSPACPSCLSMNYAWLKCSGAGIIYTWTIHHHPYIPAFKDDVPYNTAIIQLPEGPRILSTVTDIESDAFRIDFPVKVWFDDVTSEISLAKFRPV